MTAVIEKKWTVFFLIKSIGSVSTRDLIDMLNLIIPINFASNITVILCINYNRVNMDALLKLDRSLVLPDDTDDFTTMFFNMAPANGGRNILSLIGEKNDFDITNPKDLDQFFRKYILAQNRAKKYLLFTWDHGDGFGIFAGIGRGSAEQGQPHHEPDSILTMDELRQAISSALGHEQIEVVIMMNCRMQLFDTAYALRSNVKYLVAPQTSIEFFDYNYKGIFATLSANPEISSIELSRYIIECFRDKCRNISNDISLSACDVRLSGDMASLLDELAVHLFTRIQKGDFNHIVNAFKEARAVHHTGRFIDLYSLLKNLSRFLKDKEQDVLDALFELYRYVVVDCFTNLANPLPDPHYCHHGITIVSPVSIAIRRKAIAETLLESFVWETEFMRKTKWGLLTSVIDAIEQTPYEG